MRPDCDLQGNATPSGNAMAVTALLELAGLSNETRYVDLAREARTQIQPMMAQYLLGFGQWLAALSYALSRPREIVIIVYDAPVPGRAFACQAPVTQPEELKHLLDS